MSAPLSAAEYQSQPRVVERVREFCGLVSPEDPGCVYLGGLSAREGPHATWGEAPLHPPEELGELVAAGVDVVRSMWDRGSLLVYVDLDYRDADAPADVYVHPADCFLRLEPAHREVRAAFDELGMPMLDLVTGAGYAFVGRVDLTGAAAERLAGFASEPPAWFATHPRRRPPWTTAPLTEQTARAFHGLGLVLEFLGHRLLRSLGRATTVPVVINNTEVGRSGSARRSVSIDLTSLGDPLDVRHLRVAFGAYQKHRLRADLFGEEAARLPPLAVVPRGARSLDDVLERGRGLAEAAAAAETARVAIPVVEAGLLNLIEAYATSDLARWHREFYRVRPHPPESWPATYGRFDPATLPPCVAACLEHPDDLLLEPTHIQLLVRTLLARRWQARHIAGLMQSCYARPGFWPHHWERVDPMTRADFDVRVFAGLIAMGLDQGVDFNCVSIQERGMCPGGGCPFDLRRERDRLLAERAS